MTLTATRAFADRFEDGGEGGEESKARGFADYQRADWTIEGCGNRVGETRR